MAAFLRLCLLFVLVCVSRANAGFMPPRTTSSRWTSNMVLCYMDARSTGAFGPDAQDVFGWSSERFGRLLAYHNASSEAGGGNPVDTLFDSFLFSGNSWYGGKMFWPGLGKPMNKTDWVGFLNMQLTIGAANLDAAAENITSQLPFPPGQGLRPAVVLSVPYPDTRLQDWGALPGSSRSLNFSVEADRLAAVEWWVREAYAAFQAADFKHAYLSGFYWFLEEVPIGDEVLLPQISNVVHSLAPSLQFVWVPYYRPGDPHTGQWKELGFDFATLQPNYAFNNVSAKERFPAIHDLADNFALGVELELDINIRNPQAGGWEGNFETYLETVHDWESTGGSIMKTYYYGNIFVTYYARNASMFSFYSKLYNFTKGVWP